jgi:hypoxanthine-guanine phosphoribosyltransferase
VFYWRNVYASREKADEANKQIVFSDYAGLEIEKRFVVGA